MKEKKTSKKTEKFYEEIVKEVEKDFENRRKERLRLERQWELNMKFLIGDQYCDLGLNYDLIGSNGEFFWQKRDVYNHIAPIVETRIAKFAAISPVLSVRPKSDDDSDVQAYQKLVKDRKVAIYLDDYYSNVLYMYKTRAGL